MPTGVPRRRTKNLAEREIAEWNRQRTETQKQLAEKYRLENAVLKGQLLDRSELERVFSELASAIVGIIQTSGLPRESQEEIQRNLAGIPLIIQDQARRQRRGLSTKGGQASSGGQW
jgi:hypothetical protein